LNEAAIACFFLSRTLNQNFFMRRSFFASALTAGLVAGALDITGACISAYIKSDGKTTPIKVLNYVASGAIDPKTFSSPALLALFGLLVHFFIAISFTFLFFFLAKQIPAFVKYPIPIGILYGIFVWAAMKYVILFYISRHPSRPFDLKDASIQAGILVLCIGIPVALFARRYVKANK
jgi:uncharacterized membrane protein YagU involved in acid resistance